MNTYGDMVTLLLSFFIMLFAFSTLDVERFRAIKSAFQGAIGILDAGTTLTLGEGVSHGSSLEAQLIHRNPLEVPDTQDVLRRLEAVREEEGLRESFVVELDERGVVIRFTERVLFDLGKADLRPEAEGVLLAIVPVLREVPNHIRVEGHTDNLPIQTVQFPTNWELSTARAARVVRFLVDRAGFDPARLSAAGYGEYRPIASNETAEGRARNRRVDIVLLSSDLTPAEPAARLFPLP